MKKLITLVEGCFKSVIGADIFKIRQLKKEQALKAELTGLISEWEQKARRAFYDAESETDVMGKRLIEHGAMCIFNCTESLKEVLKNYEQPTSQSPLKDQT